MDDQFYLQRKNDLKYHLEEERRRINAYEEQLRNESEDVDRQERIKQKIKYHKRSFEGYLKEYNALALSGDDLQNMSEDTKNTVIEIDRKVDQLCKGQGDILEAIKQVKTEILARYHKEEREYLSPLLDRIGQINLLLTKDILEFIQNDRLSVDETSKTFEAIQESLIEIRERQVSISDPEVDYSVNQLSDALNSPEYEIKHKLELSLPIVPGILKYKAELNLKSSLNLEKAWNWLVGRIKENF